LIAQGDQRGSDYNDNTRIDQIATTGGVRITMDGESATFDRGAIRKITVDPGGGTNHEQVAAVPSGTFVSFGNYVPNTDTIVIGSDGGSLSAIQGTVNVSNGSGPTRV